MSEEIPLQKVESSQISAIGYHAQTNTLAVQFKTGAEYHYENVDPSMFEELNAAESKGSYFHKHIKPYPDRFPYIKVKPAQERNLHADG